MVISHRSVLCCFVVEAALRYCTVYKTGTSGIQSAQRMRPSLGQKYKTKTNEQTKKNNNIKRENKNELKLPKDKYFLSGYMDSA